MKLLVFEYSTCIRSPSLEVEGYNMLKSLLDDLNRLNDYDVDYLVNKNFLQLKYDNCNQIILNYDLFSWLEDTISIYDSVLFIAPEDDFIQFKLTRLFEEKNVNIIGTASDASAICCSKNRTYEYVDDDILKIPQKLINIDNINYEKIESYLKKSPLIIKPDNRTSSDLIYLIKNIKELQKVIEIYKKENMNEFLLQKYIKGEEISVSIICNENFIEILSVNTQEMIKEDNQLIYNGCKTKIKHPLENDIKKISSKIIKSIPGLKGFVGIDYIIQDNLIYFVEINSRITTPYITLQKNSDKNLTQHLIQTVNGSVDSIEILKEDLFLKR